MLIFGNLKEEPGVYMIVNPYTWDFYIGASINIKKRYKDHKYNSSNEFIRYFCKKDLIFTPLIYTPFYLLKEKEFIKKYNPTYNYMSEYQKEKRKADSQKAIDEFMKGFQWKKK